MNLPSNFFTTEYLFVATAPTNKKLFLVIFAVFVLFIIISVLLNYNRSIHPPLKSRLFNFFLTIGILGVLFSFLRYESIPYVGARFVMLLLFIFAFIWYLAITLYSMAKMPKEVRLKKAQEKYLQYLPKKKRKD